MLDPRTCTPPLSDAPSPISVVPITECMDGSALELDEYSFPEIEPDIWEQIRDKEEQHSIADKNTSLKEDGETENKNNCSSDGPPNPLDEVPTHEDQDAVSKIHIELEGEEQSDNTDSIWETFSEITDAEWHAVDSPPTSGSIANAPIYFLLDLAPPYEGSSDIEDFHMPGKTLNEAGNLLKKYKRGGSLSVTNIVAPLWCQQKIFYDLAGLRKLGAEKRPTEFKVERKVIVDNKPVIKQVIIKPDKAVYEKREKNEVRGNEIHKKLEREVAPERVAIPSTTKEERFALKILDMLTGLKALSTSRLWREMPVFGFIDGILVNGVIDELQIVPQNSENTLRISDTKTKSPKSKSKSTSFEVNDTQRLQLMLYKYLLDGLLSQKFPWSQFFEFHKLKSELTFSDGFLAQMLALSEDNQLGDLVTSCNNLKGLTAAWLDGVQALDIPGAKCDPKLAVVFRAYVSPRAQRKAQTKPLSRPTSPSEIGDNLQIVSIQEFPYDGTEMMGSVQTTMDFWLGKQPIRGVSPKETWKCDACEYKSDCEWRKEQATLLSEKSSRK